jgi:hypothetical protein
MFYCDGALMVSKLAETPKRDIIFLFGGPAAAIVVVGGSTFIAVMLFD